MNSQKTGGTMGNLKQKCDEEICEATAK